MIRRQTATLLQNRYHAFTYALSCNFHTTQIFNKKCKKERKKKSKEPPSVAVILCGCGVYDGTEVSEALCSTIHIYQRGMVPCFYAPDIDICDTVNHCTKESDPYSPPRNAVIEAARLTRSCVQPLCQCEACKHKALVIPGGFGITKTLSDFQAKGANCSILPDMERLIEDFYCEKKPIAAICIASVLVAKVLKGCKITLGREKPASDWPHADAIKEVREMGAKVEIRGEKGITRCKTYNVLSTPAWMYRLATYPDIHNTIGKLITMMKKCMKS